MLESEKIVLRPLKDSDLDFLQKIENNKENWQFGSEGKKYSKQDLVDYISDARLDISISKQYRFVIEEKENIGFIDLFDYTNESAGIGIIISKDYRNQGFGKKALKILMNYAFTVLHISKLHCVNREDNFASIGLFSACGFELDRQQDKLAYFPRYIFLTFQKDMHLCL